MTQQKISAWYKFTEVGIIPTDWEVKKIGDFCDCYSGWTPDTSNSSYYGGTIPRITSSDLNKKNIYNVNEKITELGLKNSSAKLIKKETLLLALYGATAGVSAISHINGAINQAILAIVPRKDNYIFLFQKLIYSKKRIIKTYTQGWQPNLSGEIIKSICLSLPPTLAEQSRIATTLSDMDELITQLDELIAKKKTIKQWAMQLLLTPKKDWEVKKFPSVCWFQEWPGVRNYQFTKSWVKLLNWTNIENGELLLDKTDRFISEKDAYWIYSHFLVDDGDILIACSGVTIDKFEEKVTFAWKNHLPLCMNTSTMRFKVSSDKLVKDYLYHFLKSDKFKEQIWGKATGSAQLNFWPSHVSNTDIYLPNPQEQIHIATILSDMDQEIQQLEEKKAKYEQIKQWAMQQLLTGKIRLK